MSVKYKAIKVRVEIQPVLRLFISVYRDSEKPRKGFVAQNKGGKTHFCSVKRYFPKLEFKISSEMEVAPRYILLTLFTLFILSKLTLIKQ